MIRVFITVLLLLPALNTFAQEENKFLVTFDQKDTLQEFIAADYFHPKALARRKRNGLPAYDYSDLPVKQAYIDTLKHLGADIRVITRWLNGCIVLLGTDEISTLEALSFVSSVTRLASPEPVSSVSMQDILSEADEEILDRQTAVMGREILKEQGLDGQGVRVAIFDVGFKGVNTNSSFQHLLPNIKGTWDFVRKDTNVYGYGTHGTDVLACIGGKAGDRPIGLATGAEFLLLRTERLLTEKMKEEENWLAAAEWADRHGADIINSSLGYTYHRYHHRDLDGRTSLVSRAASMAVSKGILVVNSAGNEGENKWHFLATPADADSVLTVGGIDPETGYRIGFTSYGPTADNRVKPNVSAFGKVLTAGPSGLHVAYGTSFSSPLVAGFAACVLQKYPELSAMELFRKIEQSAHLYPYYDFSHGFGVPQADKVLGTGRTISPTFQVNEMTGGLRILVTEPGQSAEKGTTPSPGLLFYHVRDHRDRIIVYKVVEITAKTPFSIDVNDTKGAAILSVSYQGYTLETKFR